jgi:hypothetical protein
MRPAAQTVAREDADGREGSCDIGIRTSDSSQGCCPVEQICLAGAKSILCNELR